jgi:hypothetical protein
MRMFGREEKFPPYKLRPTALNSANGTYTAELSVRSGVGWESNT